MAVALGYVEVFKVLLNGGFITATHYANGRRSTYTVITKTGGPQAGRITETQFHKLLTGGVISEISPTPSKDDDKNLYYYYEINTTEQG